jgi:hypothetical protein
LADTYWSRLDGLHGCTSNHQGGQAVSKASDLIEEYLSVGGLFNPEIMNQMQHDAVRDTLIIARDEIRGLEKRIKRLEDAGDVIEASLKRSLNPNEQGECKWLAELPMTDAEFAVFTTAFKAKEAKL